MKVYLLMLMIAMLLAAIYAFPAKPAGKPVES
jgi:hypothetical protein